MAISSQQSETISKDASVTDSFFTESQEPKVTLLTANKKLCIINAAQVVDF